MPEDLAGDEKVKGAYQLRLNRGDVQIQFLMIGGVPGIEPFSQAGGVAGPVTQRNTADLAPHREVGQSQAAAEQLSREHVDPGAVSRDDWHRGQEALSRSNFRTGVWQDAPQTLQRQLPAAS